MNTNKLKPILFNTPMVRAILDGRKTQTRRVVKYRPEVGFGEQPIPPDDEYIGMHMGLFVFRIDDADVYVDAPYQPLDILYVRETWTKFYYADPNGVTHYDQPMFYYAADGKPDITLVDEDGFEKDDQGICWHPSIHMPKEAARIFLRVTDVRVERLQDITVPELQSEGLLDTGYISQYAIMTSDCFGQFKALWNGTIKPADLFRYGWDANPWVWVYAFERVSKEEAYD